MHSVQPYINLGRMLAAFLLLFAVKAHADVTFNVTSTLDQIDDNTNDGVCRTTSNTCTLRAAIMQANHWGNPEFAIINVPAGIYRLTLPIPIGGFDDERSAALKLSPPLIAVQRIAVIGENAVSTIIDGNHASTVFNIGAGRSALLSKLTIRNGNTIFTAGGVNNNGDLTIANSVVENNAARGGGGGIYNNARLRIVDSTISGNTTESSGGGLYVLGPTQIVQSTFVGNSADDGGGIYNNSDTLSLVNSTISLNLANNNGGGIYTRGSAFAYNITVTDNDADDDHDAMGGIGGGVFATPSARFLLANSLVMRNSFVAYVNPNDCHGNFEVYGKNLLSDVTGCTFTGNGATAWGLSNPQTIGPLANNGGPTFTNALLPGSGAINGTPVGSICGDELGTPLASDQRGAPRVLGPRCDIGAFEYVLEPVFNNGFE